jgi:KEOPS complex subunit Pcc1
MLSIYQLLNNSSATTEQYQSLIFRRDFLKLDAEFIFETENAEVMYKALLPELKDNYSDRSVIDLTLKDKNKLMLNIKAEDVVSLRSAINTWFRLIQITEEVFEITPKLNME